jgi:hypothetical protein
MSTCNFLLEQLYTITSVRLFITRYSSLCRLKYFMNAGKGIVVLRVY